MKMEMIMSRFSDESVLDILIAIVVFVVAICLIALIRGGCFWGYGT